MVIAPPVRVLSRRWRPRPQVCSMCMATAQAGFSSSARSLIGLKYLEKVKNAEEDWARQAELIKNGEKPHLWDILEERGFVKDTAGSREHIRELMRVKRIKAYVGVDPTGQSLHVGHLLPLMPVFWMYMHGYGGFTLVGGATAKVGDPSDRLTDRKPQNSADRAKYAVSIQYQIKKLWSNVVERATAYGYEQQWAWERAIVNNSDWITKLGLSEFLRVLGSGIRVGPMLSRDTVKRKLTEGDGLSFAELAYPLLQGWDWWTLYNRRGVQMQIGGSDQFGNIVSGVEAVKIAREAETHDQRQFPTGFLHDPVGFTVPLLTNSAGEKIGKSTSAGGSGVWLDGITTSAFDLYGYFVRQPDEDVERMLKLLTFMPTADIRTLMEQHEADKPKRLAQHRLAFEVMCLVHGKDVAKHVQHEHQVLHGKSPDPVKFQNNQPTLNTAGAQRIALPRSLVYGSSIARILYGAGLASSVSDGHRLATQKAAYVGGLVGTRQMVPGTVTWHRVATWFPEQTQKFVIDDKVLMLRKGKHIIRIVDILSDEEFDAAGLNYPGQPFTGRVRQMSEARKAAKKAEAQSTEDVQREMARGAGVDEAEEADKADEVSQAEDAEGADHQRLDSVSKKDIK